MSTNRRALVLLAVAFAACGRTWPDPPPVDATKYQADYQAWREERQENLLFAVRIVGIWPLEDGDNPFGSDGSLPIVLPARVFPPRAGLFRRTGDKVEVVMTMTSPACPLGGQLASEAEAAVRRSAPEVTEIDVRLVLFPPWHPGLMSDAARRQLGWND